MLVRACDTHNPCHPPITPSPSGCPECVSDWRVRVTYLKVGRTRRALIPTIHPFEGGDVVANRGSTPIIGVRVIVPRSKATPRCHIAACPDGLCAVRGGTVIYVRQALHSKRDEEKEDQGTHGVRDPSRLRRAYIRCRIVTTVVHETYAMGSVVYMRKVAKYKIVT